MFLFLLSAVSSRPATIPAPLEITTYDEIKFKISDGMLIQYDKNDANCTEVAKFACDLLSAPTGYTFKLTADPISTGIRFQRDSTLGDEEYKLVTDEKLILITASTKHGYFYGFQTMIQQLPPQIYSANKVTGEWIVPGTIVHDKPRFHWRGLMIDIARHFFDLDTLKNIVKVLGMHKMNHLHIHINDDQGWRIEIKKYPLLTSLGSKRAESPKPWDRHNGDGIPYGPYFYTQDQFRELVAFAHKYCVIIIPEVEFPGHTQPAMAGYPEFSCTGGPIEPLGTWFKSGIPYCTGNDKVFDFLSDIFDEVVDVFDSDIIHIGGDEVDQTEWKKCSKCAKRMQDEGIKSYSELQSWFIHKVQLNIEAKGRYVMGWDETLEQSKDPNLRIMIWRDVKTAIKAVQSGHHVVMTPSVHTYLPRGQTQGTDKYEYSCCYTPASDIYNYDPLKGIEQYADYVYGYQVSMWTEYVWGGNEDLHWKLFPRTSALAESAWTSLERKNWDAFAKGYNSTQFERLRIFNITSSPFVE